MKCLAAVVDEELVAGAMLLSHGDIELLLPESVPLAEVAVLVAVGLAPCTPATRAQWSGPYRRPVRCVATASSVGGCGLPEGGRAGTHVSSF